MPGLFRRIRQSLFDRSPKQNGQVKCHWCPRMLTFKESTLDHEPALSEGGSVRQAVIACRECNERRGRVTLRKKLDAMRRRRKITKVLKAIPLQETLRIGRPERPLDRRGLDCMRCRTETAADDIEVLYGNCFLCPECARLHRGLVGAVERCRVFRGEIARSAEA
jgi:hypothetical protein